MNRSMIAGIVVGAVAATAVGAVAGYRAYTAPAFAEVVGSTPVKQMEQVRQQECDMVPVVRRRAVKDEHQLLGTAAGAVVGGVIGNQIGGGRGRDLATVAGAAGGGYAGNRIQKNMQERDTYTTQEKRCRTVERPVERVVGYDVQYTLGGKPGQVRMDRPPPERIPVKDGRLVLEPAAADAKG